jgi:hypothetical protein
MIEKIVIDYLEGDSTLTTLLGATASDTKIYPLQVQQGRSTPYIVYNTSSDGTPEENLLELTMDFRCVDENYNTSKNIRDRLSILLDQQDAIQRLIVSSDYYVYWAKKIGEKSFTETVEPNLNFIHRVVTVDFKYRRGNRI